MLIGIIEEFNWEASDGKFILPEAIDGFCCPGLFNGNIHNIGYTIKGLTPLTIGYAYLYDQLNRLTDVTPFDNFNTANYKWSSSGSGMTAYKENLAYDANGNIVTYLRKGAVSQVNMDYLTYNYTSGTNKLVKVDDAISSGNYPSDIDQQSSNNYVYDNSGNLIEDKKEKLDITWTAYGKVDSIYNDNTDLAMNFGYDASQNRLSKRVIATGSSDTTSTYYIRDAQGNIMAMYELKEDTVRWIEQDLYGSSRLGVLNPDSVVYPGSTYSKYFHHLQGRKQYELTNHLGNVLTTINDRKIGVDTATTNGNYDYWLAVQVSAQDYYSGGMVMPDRNFSNENYGFGFNGKPKDDEINGSGDSYDYGYRIYDPRIARFLSVDPLSKGYPFYSPYQFAGNTPIAAVDVDGLEPTTIIDKNGNLTKPIIGFLQGAIDIQRRVSESTLWMEGSRSAIWKLSAKPTADTWGNTVFFDPSLQSNMDEHFWAQLVGHEQTHRMQIDKIGWIPFASAYYKEYKENKKKGLDDYDAYRRISYEAEAYAQEAKLADFFSDPGNTKGFDFIIHNALLTDQEKSEELEIEGIEKVAIPAIENTMQDVQTVMSETKNRTKKAYLEGLYDQLGKDLQSKKNRAATLKQQLNGSK